MATTARKDYAAIAKAKIVRPSQMTRKPTIFIYARNKKGKSTFCASPGEGNVLIIDPDNEGTKKLTKIDPEVWPISVWDDIDDVYKFLRLGKHNYQWVALDGLTKIQSMCQRWVMNQAEERDLDRRQGTLKIQDYGQVGKMMEAMITNFQNLKNVGLIITAQEKMVEGNSAGDDADDDAEDSAAYFLPNLQSYVAGVVNGAADIIGRLYVVKTTLRVRDNNGEIVEKEGMQRRLWLDPNTAYATGYRSEYQLPSYLKNPTVGRLMNLIDTGKVR